MRVKFSYKGHTIEFKRAVAIAEMYIDGKICDNKKGMMDIQVKNFDLTGTLFDEEKGTVNIRLHTEPRALIDEVTLFADNEFIMSVGE